MKGIPHNFMNINLIFYLILGIVQIAFGFAGSYYTLIVCGMLLIFKAVSIVVSNSKKVLRSMICAPFILICVYMIYYSFYMFTAELDYASVRPQIWLILPIVLNFIIFLIMFLSAYDSVHGDENTDILLSKNAMDNSIEDMTIFAILFVGWLGTFVFDFYFDYAASLSLIVCLVKKIKDFILTTHTTTHTTTISD